jgi:hypothetical protein
MTLLYILAILINLIGFVVNYYIGNTLWATINAFCLGTLITMLNYL